MGVEGKGGWVGNRIELYANHGEIYVPLLFKWYEGFVHFLGWGSKTMTTNFQFVGLEGYLSYIIKLRLLS